MFRIKTHSGFTLVEIVVVIGIITVMLAVVIASMNDARRNSRDKDRIAKLAQVGLAINTYLEASPNRQYPATVADIEPFLTGINDPAANYDFDTFFACADAHYVVATTQLEREENGNIAELCDCSDSSDPDCTTPTLPPGTYALIIDGPLLGPPGKILQDYETNEEFWYDQSENQSGIITTDPITGEVCNIYLLPDGSYTQICN